MPDDDDRSRDASGAAGPGSPDADQRDTAWSEASAPDDISSLAKDIQAYRREVRAARRHELIARFTDRPGAAPITITITAVALIAILATLLALLVPNRTSTTLSPLPLAQTTTVTGIPGGMLPSVSLRQVGGPTRNAVDLRPGVVALLPAQCACGTLVTSLAQAAAAEQFPLFAVSPTSQSADADSLIGRLPPTDGVFYDPYATVASSVSGVHGLTLVLVNRDGTIASILPNITTASMSTLQADLTAMRARSGATG